jgi:hypothetical protein
VLRDYGISLAEPSGWYTRFYRVVEPLLGAAILQAATVPLVESDYATYQPDTCATLGANDALLIAMIFDPDPGASSLPRPRLGALGNFAFAPAHFTHLQSLSMDQIQARTVFILGDRICELVACFGSSNPDAGLLGRIVSSLRSLDVPATAQAKDPHGDAVEVRLRS